MPSEYERSFDPSPNFDRHYQALRAFGYGEGEEGYLDREVIFKLDPRVTYKRHSQFIRMGFITEVNPQFMTKGQWSECGHCGQKFMSMGSRDAHVIKRHVRASEPKIQALSDLPAEERMKIASEAMQGERIGGGDGISAYKTDGPTLLPGQFDPEMKRIEREEAELNKVAPIFFENTEASRKAGENVYEMQGEHEAARPQEKKKGRPKLPKPTRKAIDTFGGNKNVRASS